MAFAGMFEQLHRSAYVCVREGVAAELEAFEDNSVAKQRNESCFELFPHNE